MPSIDGLISGMDTSSIIEQLVAINRIPIDKLNFNIEKKTVQNETLQLFSTKILDLKLKAFNLTRPSTYRANDTSSSNESVLMATGTPSNSTGSFDFRVARLASSAQAVSDGLADQDSTPLGAGSFTIEMGGGFIDNSTKVSALNGGSGFERGSISITDGAGTNKKIDLSLAVSVQDILNTINETSGLQVSASVSADSIVLTDTSGSSSVTVAEVEGGQTASSLGLLKTDSAGVITGDSVNTISLTTPIDILNDGNGVRTLEGENDLNFTTRLGGVADFSVDLGTLNSLQDVITAINSDAANDNYITASLDADGKSLKLVDNTAGAGAFTISASTGAFGTTSGALVDLGLSGVSAELAGTGAIDPTGTTISGKRLIASLNSTLTRSLNGGGGVQDGEITITDRVGASATIDLSARVYNSVFVEPNVGDTSITLSDLAAQGFEVGNRFRITDGVDSEYRTITNIDRSGTEAVISFTDSLTIDFDIGDSLYASNESLGDVINAINNNSNVQVSATYNKELNGLKISDNTAGAPTSDLSVVEVASTTAYDLGIRTGITGVHTVTTGGSKTQLVDTSLIGIGLSDDELNGLELVFDGAAANPNSKRTISDFDAATGTITFSSAFAADIALDNYTITGIDQDSFNGFDANVKYISENDKLEDLNYGKGVFKGTFRVTDTDNKIFQVSLSNADDLGDVIFQFNSAASTAGSDSRLSINANGNGLLLNSPTGTGSITVQDINGGTSAKDLNIEGVAVGTSTVDGALEYKINLTGTETLQDLKDTINNLNMPLRATIIDDGSSINPYRLNFVSELSGSDGRLLIDDFDNSFNFATTTKAQDAALLFGGTSAGSSPVLVTDNDNIISNLVPGLSLTLKQVSTEAVTVNITRNTEEIVNTIDEFVEGFNEILVDLKEYTNYKEDNESPAILQGNFTMRSIEADMFRVVNSTVKELSGSFRRLSSIGVKLKSDGTGIEFNRNTLITALNENYDEVVDLLDMGGSISETTQLSSLRGGAGLRRSGGNDFKVQMKDGTSYEINTSEMNNVAEVLVALNFNAANSSGDLVASLKADGSGIEIVDSSTGTSDFVITNINGSSAATDLGISQSGIESGTDEVIKGFSIRDRGIFAAFNASLGFIVNSGGKLAKQTDTFNAMIADFEDQIETIEARVQNQQERLFSEFANLENVLSGLQTQSSFLSALIPR